MRSPMKKLITLAVGLLAVTGLTTAGPAGAAQAAACTLSNPIVRDGADPSVWYRNGTYYLVQSVNPASGPSTIVLRASSTLNGLSTATVRTVWTAPSGTDHSKEVWAPELEFLNGQWVIYFAADGGNNDDHRIFAITHADGDPTAGAWSFFGKIADSTNQWAIDATVLTYENAYWMIWSGTPTGNGGRAPQQIYIAHMSDPLHIDQDHRRLIANPDQSWETSVAAIEEGPEAWVGPNGKLTIVYNANASWTSSYALGELVFNGGDMTDYRSYTKRGPVFSSANGLYGTGGESIPVPGAAGVNWNVFHADTDPNGGWAGRSIFAQPVPWNSDGTPNFGTPAGAVSYNEQAQTRC